MQNMSCWGAHSSLPNLQPCAICLLIPNDLQDFLDAVTKVIKGLSKFSATPAYMVHSCRPSHACTQYHVNRFSDRQKYYTQLMPELLCAGAAGVQLEGVYWLACSGNSWLYCMLQMYLSWPYCMLQLYLPDASQ